MLDRIAKYHDDWIRIAMSLLGNKEDAEDLVQDMYIAISSSNMKVDDRFVCGVNKMYIYMALKNIALDKIKKRKPDITYIDYIESFDKEPQESDEYADIINDIDKEMDSWTWYDRTLFEMYMYSGLSMRDIAYGTDKEPRWLTKDRKICDYSIISGTGISLSSIYNTIKRCKERIKLNVIPNTKKVK